MSNEHHQQQQQQFFQPSPPPQPQNVHSGVNMHHAMGSNQYQQHHHQQGSQPPLFQDLAAGGQFIHQVADNPLAQIGLQYGGKVFAGGREYMDQKIGHYISQGVLKYYFNVNNSYVLNKLKLLLFPVFHRSWKRRIVRTSSGDQFLPPRDDINAPDLYIPIMAFVTYVLAVAFVYGTAKKFTPEIMGMTSSTAMVLLALEVLFLKAGFYVTSAGSVSILDIVAYCGYKYVSIVVSILAGIFGTYVYYLVSIGLGVMMGFFMVRTMRVVILSDPTNPAVVDVHSQGESAMYRNYLVLLVGVIQPLLVYFLGVTA